MASLRYLWQRKARFPFASMNYFKAWAKRLLSLPELFSRNIKRLRLVSQGSQISETAEIGKVKITGPKKFLKVGNFTFLGRVTIALHDELIIGSNVCINDNVEILTASHDVNDKHWKHKKARIIIEDYVWVGTGALILPGVHLAKGSVVGARSVVTKSTEPGQIVVGNPAKAVSKERSADLDYNPCEFLASNRAWLKG